MQIAKKKKKIQLLLVHYLAAPACARHVQQESRDVDSLAASRRSVSWCSRVCASLRTRQILVHRQKHLNFSLFLIVDFKLTVM